MFTRFISALVFAACSCIAPLAQALDFIVNGQFNPAVSKGYKVQIGDTVGGYPIFSNDGDWKISYTFMGSTLYGDGPEWRGPAGFFYFSWPSASTSPLRRPEVGMERYDENGNWIMSQWVAVTIDQTGGNGGEWKAEPCGGEKIIKFNTIRAGLDRCAASEFKTVKRGGLDTEILRMTFAETNIGGRLYLSVFDIHFAQLGLTRAEVADNSSDFNRKLRDWMGKFLNATVNAAGFGKPPDAFKNIQTFAEGTGISRVARGSVPTAPNAKVLHLETERKKFEEEFAKLDAEIAKQQQAKITAPLSIQATATKPNSDGDFVIYVQTSAETASLKIDDEEQGANKTGVYTIRWVARVGMTNIITILAKDIHGNTDTKTISVTRQAVDSRPTFARLNPANIKPQPTRDAVAIIIGIQNYKLIPKAEYASQDAQDFYDYASRALGIRQENIKLLLDDEADVSGILTAFQNWLPLKVRKGKTDVYVFYSGHGLPSPDGKSLFFLPVGANKDFVAKTAISQQEIVAGLKAAQPKSVTMFVDSCYSGQIRTGETLLASARPVVLTVQETAYPPDFTVITASASDQIASSSPDLKHGIFSYYLMKGLEGEADDNKDGTITIGKLQSYLAERVPRFAMTMSRKQEPQLTGDANRVLVAR